MAENSKIGWTTHTANWWGGCTKVSPGCANCYAEHATPSRKFHIEWGRGAPRHLFTSTAHTVAKLNRAAKREGEAWWRLHDSHAGTDPGTPPTTQRVFWQSLSDWLDPEVPIEWLADMLECVHGATSLYHLMLTKRPQLWRERMNQVIVHVESRPDVTEEFNLWLTEWMEGDAPINVMVMTSCEDQERADLRVPQLLAIPAHRRGISAEPLLGPINWTATARHFTAIDWVILGGESGPDARPCHMNWISDSQRQLAELGVPCFVKQLGAIPALPEENWIRHAERFGRNLKDAIPIPGTNLVRWPLADRKGEDLSEWPEAFRVQEDPRDHRESRLTCG
jgi:protein gp37